jgi:hypothetical protein
MALSRDQLVQFVEECIGEMLIEIAIHPLCHFSEKSLQLRLSSKLLACPELATPLPTSIPRRYGPELERIAAEEQTRSSRDIQPYYDETFKTIPLQMEYGNNLTGPYRVDIAVLDPEEIHTITNPQLQDEDVRYLKPLVGVEFGTEKSGWKQMTKKHLENDLKKVRDSHFGYTINIMRNANFSTRSSGRNTEKQIRINRFKDSLKQYAQAHGSVAWIGMVIDIALAEVFFLSRDFEWLRFDLPAP